MIGQKPDHFYCLTHSFAELNSAENVEMKMLNRLASVVTAICDNAVTPAEIFALGDLGNSFKDLCNERAVFRIDFICRCNMYLGHYKNMYGCLRVDIAESINIFVLVDLRRGDLTLDYLAKNAVHYSARTVTLPLVSSVIRSMIPTITPMQKKQRIPTTRVVVFLVSR